MSVYNPLLRVAQMAKTGEISRSLKGTSEASRGSGSGAIRWCGISGRLPARRRRSGGSGRCLRIRRGSVRVSVSGRMRPGTGVKEGFGLNPANPGDTVKQSTRR